MEGMLLARGITNGMVTMCRDGLRGHWGQKGPQVPPSSGSARTEATGKSEFGNAARTQVVEGWKRGVDCMLQEMGTLGKFWHKEVR